MLRILMTLAFALPTMSAIASPHAPPAATGEMPQAHRPATTSPLICTPDMNRWGNSSACQCPTDYQYNQRAGICELTSTELGLLEGEVPRNGSCSNADGTILLSVSQYQGGPAPFPGMIVNRISLTKDGEVLGEQRSEYGEAAPLGHWPFNVLLDDRIDIARHGNSAVGSVTYSVLLTVNRLDGSGVEFSSRVICEYSWNRMIP